MGKKFKGGFRNTRDGFDDVETNILVRELCRPHLSVSKYVGQLSEGEVSAVCVDAGAGSRLKGHQCW